MHSRQWLMMEIEVGKEAAINNSHLGEFSCKQRNIYLNNPLLNIVNTVSIHHTFIHYIFIFCTSHKRLSGLVTVLTMTKTYFYCS